MIHWDDIKRNVIRYDAFAKNIKAKTNTLWTGLGHVSFDKYIKTSDEP